MFGLLNNIRLSKIEDYQSQKDNIVDGDEIDDKVDRIVHKTLTDSADDWVIVNEKIESDSGLEGSVESFSDRESLEDDWEDIERSSDENQEIIEANANKVRNQLVGGKRLDQNAPVVWLEKFPEESIAICEGMFGIESSAQAVQSRIAEGIENAKNEGKPLFIPLVLKGGFAQEDHIVLLSYDPKEDSFSYYDPKGKDISRENREILGLDVTPHNLIKSFGLIESSREKHQGRFDGTNCGAYVMWKIGHILGKDGFDAQPPKSIRLMRNKLANAINEGEKIPYRPSKRRRLISTVGGIGKAVQGLLPSSRRQEHNIPNETTPVKDYSELIDTLQGLETEERALFRLDFTQPGHSDFRFVDLKTKIAGLIEQAKTEGKPLFIPIELEGGDEALVIYHGQNQLSQGIEYFDPQGEIDGVRGDNRNIQGQDFTPSELFKGMGPYFGSSGIATSATSIQERIEDIMNQGLVVKQRV